MVSIIINCLLSIYFNLLLFIGNEYPDSDVSNEQDGRKCIKYQEGDSDADIDSLPRDNDINFYENQISVSYDVSIFR